MRRKVTQRWQRLIFLVCCWAAVNLFQPTPRAQEQQETLPLDLSFLDLYDLEDWYAQGLFQEEEWSELLAAWESGAEPPPEALWESVRSFGTVPLNPFLSPWEGPWVGSLRSGATYSPQEGELRHWSRLLVRSSDGVELSGTVESGEMRRLWNREYQRVDREAGARLQTGYLRLGDPDSPGWLLLGDFSADVGGGLILNTGRYRIRRGVRPNGTRTLRDRGAAGTLLLEGWEGGLFLSYRDESVQLLDSTLGAEAGDWIGNGLRRRRLGGYWIRKGDSWEAGITALSERTLTIELPIRVEEAPPSRRGSVFLLKRWSEGRALIEAAYSGGWAGRIELSRRAGWGNLFLQVDRAEPSFWSPAGTHRLGRMYVYGRGTLRPVSHWTFGARVEHHYPWTGPATGRAWVWIRTTALGKIRTGLSLRWEQPELLGQGTPPQAAILWLSGSGPLEWSLRGSWEPPGGLRESTVSLSWASETFRLGGRLALTRTEHSWKHSLLRLQGVWIVRPRIRVGWTVDRRLWPELQTRVRGTLDWSWGP